MSLYIAKAISFRQAFLGVTHPAFVDGGTRRRLARQTYSRVHFWVNIARSLVYSPS